MLNYLKELESVTGEFRQKFQPLVSLCLKLWFYKFLNHVLSHISVTLQTHIISIYDLTF